MESKRTTIGYKITDKNLQTRNGFQLTVGQSSSVEGELILYENGIHYCTRAIDCHWYVDKYKRPLRFLRVSPISDIVSDEDKKATLSLYPDTELTKDEWLSIAAQEMKVSDVKRDANKLLYLASELGDVKYMQLAIEKGADEFKWALPYVASSGNVNAMKFLIEAGWGSHQRVDEITLKWALNSAARYGHIDAVRVLIETGADDLGDAFMSAARRGNTDVVKVLISATENGKRTKTFNQAIVNNPARYGCTDVIKMLMKNRGANDFNKALANAAAGGHIIVAELLIDKGANDLNEALYIATRYGRIAMVQLLLKRGANDLDNRLSEAAEYGHIEIMQLLLENGANDFFDWALCMAAYGGHTAAIDLLIKKGNINNAIQLAEKYRYWDARDRLKKRALDLNIDIIR